LGSGGATIEEREKEHRSVLPRNVHWGRSGNHWGEAEWVFIPLGSYGQIKCRTQPAAVPQSQNSELRFEILLAVLGIWGDET